MLSERKDQSMFLNLVLTTSANGLVGSEMELENKLGLTGHVMKEIGKTIVHLVKVNSFTLMGTFTRETGSTTRLMATEFMYM
jgi:hypothetical protein